MTKIGFDNDKYISTQSQSIRERIDRFGGKLYLEFGGKLFDDLHAARVLPGFQKDSKIRMLLKLREQAEVIIAIGAGAIEANKRRGDLDITYDVEVVRLIEEFESMGLLVSGVVITQYANQPAADVFRRKLDAIGIPSYLHYTIKGYPNDVALIVSDEGMGRNEYIKTTRPLVIVTGPGPGSGKMATCISQLYHDQKNGIRSGYAKFETFPIHNLPLNHPVNLAYEAATADLNDINMIDPFHHTAYGIIATNYNRDVEIFPVLEEMLKKIDGTCPYKSPTDMGVNMAGFCICDDEVVNEASRMEIIRRYYDAKCAVRKGLVEQENVRRIELVMKRAEITVEDRPVIAAANAVSEQMGGEPAAALMLPDRSMVTGKTKPLLGAAAAMLLNALKKFGNIPDDVHLISSSVLEPVQKLKVNYFGSRNPRLHTDEVLLALSICAATDENAAIAMAQLPKLVGCDMHSSVLLSAVDLHTLKKLGITVTCEPKTQERKPE